MAVVFFLTIPGLVLGLVLLASLDRLALWAHGRSWIPWYRDGNRQVSAVGIDEMQAVFYGSKRHELEQRRISLILRDEENDAAPPRDGVDLDGGTAVIRRPPGTP